MANAQEDERRPLPPRWWLAINGQPEGPHSHAYVVACLKTGQLDANVLACPESGQRWAAISSWPAFAMVPTTASSPLPVADQIGYSKSDNDVGMLTNPQLPLMANVICIYCIVITPILWTVNVSLTLVLGVQNQTAAFFTILASVLDTIITMMLFVGGLRFRDLRASGSRLIKLGCWVSIVSIAVLLLAGILLAMIETVPAPEEQIPWSPLEFFSCLLIPIYIGGRIFEVTSLIWLTWNTPKLNLRAG